MMEKNYPVVGQKITFYEELKNGKKVEYVSQVEEILEEKKMKIAVPIKNHQLVTIINGSVLEIIYNFEKLGVYSFKGKVLSKYKEKIPTMLIEIISPVKKSQRRNFFRLELIIPVQIKRIEDIIYEKGLTKDLSGGGVKIHTEMKLELDESIKIEFSLGENSFSLEALVKNIKKSEESGYEISLEFIDISDIDRNDIIGYLFEQQRMLIKRGMR